MNQEISFLYEYNEWANERLIGLLRQLTPEQLHRDLGASHKSIRDTFAHVVGAEWSWLQRWKGQSPKVRPAWYSEADIPELVERLGSVTTERRERLAQTTDLDEVITVTALDGSQWTLSVREMLLHVVTHSILHRGQVVSMIRQAGGKPESLDLMIFATSKRATA